MRVLAAAGVAGGARQHHGDLAGLMPELPVLVGEQTADRPQFNRYLAESQCAASAKAFVAVGDHEAPAELNHGDWREHFAVRHRLTITLDALGRVRCGKEIEDFSGSHGARLKFTTCSVESYRGAELNS